MREGLWLIQKKGNLFLLIKSYLRTPKRKKVKHPEVSRENLYGYRELSADITCSKMQTIFESEALGKLFSE